MGKNEPSPIFPIPYSLFAASIRYSLFAFSQHASANQRFHVLDVLPADLVGDGTDAGRARHRVPSEEQVIAGADQAGVEQHGIDGAELAGPDAFGEQAAMEIKQGCHEEL